MQKFVYIVIFSIGFMSCSDSTDDNNADAFDRGAMLANWADNIIVPAYTGYVATLVELQAATASLVQEQSEDNLIALRQAYMNAYLAWQHVAIYEIGEAERIGLHGYTNTFPSDTDEIEIIIQSGEYNLELPSRRNQQGFPAIDYMLYGGTGQIDMILQGLTPERLAFLEDIVARVSVLPSQVLNDWNNGYRDAFVSNTSSDASGAVNKLVNDYVFYFEKYLRTDKIGIPAGVFSGTSDADAVEGNYVNDQSKVLFNQALNSSVNFFNGIHFGGSTDGISLDDYLDYVNEIQNAENLSDIINDQFVVIEQKATLLDDSFSNQVENDNTLMFDTFDELQVNVINMKSDMLQALDIRVDYQDADGD